MTADDAAGAKKADQKRHDTYFGKMHVEAGYVNTNYKYSKHCHCAKSFHLGSHTTSLAAGESVPISMKITAQSDYPWTNVMGDQDPVELLQHINATYSSDSPITMEQINMAAQLEAGQTETVGGCPILQFGCMRDKTNGFLRSTMIVFCKNQYWGPWVEYVTSFSLHSPPSWH